jgi:hypothetical protein
MPVPRTPIVFSLILALNGRLAAQAPPPLPAGGLGQLQVVQAPVDLATPLTATAGFDPPVARPGQKTYYRVTVDATESSIHWPDHLAAPAGLVVGHQTRGQLTQRLAGRYRPLSSFIYEVRAPAAGLFTITNFTVEGYGQAVEIPDASLEVVDQTNGSATSARELLLKTPVTNVFLGQPFPVQVLLPASPAHEIEILHELQFNGDGFMTDKSAARQSIEVVNLAGELTPAFIHETVVTPIATGPLQLSAQAFTAGREFNAAIAIQTQVKFPDGPTHYVLLASEPVTINVLPLPAEGRLPGFTGSLGEFKVVATQLSTNRVRPGEPVHLGITIQGTTDLDRLVPPALPDSAEWELVGDPPPGLGYTLIPLTDQATNTPAIPYSSFDPVTARYVDLTIPALPIAIVSGILPVELPAGSADTASVGPTRISDLASQPGWQMAGLKPLQLRGWFIGLQLLPVAGLFGLLQWDRRRRFLEAHPGIVRRRQARRALRRERRRMQTAGASGDAAAFFRHAAQAMQIATAPHYPAPTPPQALTGGDVLSRLDEADRRDQAGETVRQVFAASDARFATSPPKTAGWQQLLPEVEKLLRKMGERL